MRSSFAAVFSRGVLEKIHDLSRVDKLIRQPRLLPAEGVRTVDDAFNERGGEKISRPLPWENWSTAEAASRQGATPLLLSLRSLRPFG